MIEAEKRKAIYLLHQSGMSVRQIARRLSVSRNTVREVIAQQGEPPQRAPVDPPVDPDLLRTLYEQCQGRAQRVYEKLREEHGAKLPYSSLTRWLRQLGLSHPPQPRCARVPDEPGGEMQHDTSPYVIELGGQPLTLIASLLYLRYSKRRYLRFYRAFNRFKMKCFFHQALLYWGYSAPQCIIDNTNLARLCGLGANAVIVPEMEAFSRQRLIEYPLAPEGVRGQIFAPKDAPPPRGQPINRKHSSAQEETHLRALDPDVGLYLDFCLKTPGLQRHVFLRRLFLFSRRLTPDLFVASVRRAHHYQITRLEVLERIAQLLLTQGLFEPITPEIDETFRQRDTYQQGALTDPPDLSSYQVPPPPPQDPEPPAPDSHG